MVRNRIKLTLGAIIQVATTKAAKETAAEAATNAAAETAKEAVSRYGATTARIQLKTVVQCLYQCMFSGAELIGGKMKKNDLWFQENVFTGHTHFSPCLSTLEGHERGCAITYCTFSHDENTIASAASDNKIIVWDSHAGSEIITFVGHTHNVRCVQYSPDDSSLVMLLKIS